MLHQSKPNVLVQLHKVRYDTTDVWVWTLNRSPAPPQLVATGVQEYLWNSTYDQVVEHNNIISRILDEISEERKRVMWLGVRIAGIIAFLPPLFSYQSDDGAFLLRLPAFFLGAFFCPLFLFCLPRQRAWFASKRAETVRCIRNWAAFVDEQNMLYQPLGIKVSAIRQKKSKKIIIGGICLVEDTGCNGDKENALSNDNINNGNKGSILLKNLESLDRLFQSGSLNPEEFSQAKQQILNGSSIPVPTAQTNVAVPVVSTTPLVEYYAQAVTTGEIEQIGMRTPQDETRKGSKGSVSKYEIV